MNEVTHPDGQAIPDEAPRGVAAEWLIREGMAALVAAGQEAQRHRNGRELAVFERDFPRIAILVDALAGGNYRDTAAKLAGVASSSLRAWVKAAEDGNARYEAVASVIQTAEAIAEAECVKNVRSAARDPRFWAAGMTWLERKYPEKYGRRQEDNSAPKIAVQIGVDRAEVRVGIEAFAPQPAIGAGTTDTDT